MKNSIKSLVGGLVAAVLSALPSNAENESLRIVQTFNGTNSAPMSLNFSPSSNATKNFDVGLDQSAVIPSTGPVVYSFQTYSSNPVPANPAVVNNADTGVEIDFAYGGFVPSAVPVSCNISHSSFHSPREFGYTVLNATNGIVSSGILTDIYSTVSLPSPQAGKTSHQGKPFAKMLFTSATNSLPMGIAQDSSNKSFFVYNLLPVNSTGDVQRTTNLVDGAGWNNIGQVVSPGSNVPIYIIDSDTNKPSAAEYRIRQFK